MEVCSIVTKTYEKSFTVENFQSGFRQCGIHALNDVVLFDLPQRSNHTKLSGIASIAEMCTMVDEWCKDFSNLVFENIEVLETGNINNRYGTVVTSDKALQLLNENAAAKKRGSCVIKAAKAENQDAWQLERMDCRRKRKSLELHRAEYCSKKYGDGLVLPRSLAKRRAKAREMVAHKSEENVGSKEISKEK